MALRAKLPPVVGRQLAPASRGAMPLARAPWQARADASGIVQRLRALQRAATGVVVQLAVFKEGGKDAVAVPAAARSVAKRVGMSSLAPGGSRHIANVQNRGLIGYKFQGKEYVGGAVFNNGAQPDHNKLPYMGGQTYREWDVQPAVAGQNRGTERVVSSSDGRFFYTNDHYSNFTEFKP